MRAFLPIYFLLLFVSSKAQVSNNFWADTSEPAIRNDETPRYIIPDAYRVLTLDLESLKAELQNAPMEGNSDAANTPLLLTLPMPDGTMEIFEIFESPVMMEGLATRYPMIKTFAGKSVSNDNITVRFDYTLNGFHGVIRSPEGQIYIDPYAHNQTEYYISYYTKDHTNPGRDINFECGVGSDEYAYLTDNINVPDEVFQPNIQARQTEDVEVELRTYRLALACTGQYADYHGGTKPLVLSAMVEAVNRLNSVFETEIAVRLILIENNDDIIFLDSDTDGYTNGDPGAMIGENQFITDTNIGPANYDIGHVFGTIGNFQGLAQINAVCNNGTKARAASLENTPVGDVFVINIVAHEMGHQFSGRHTMNSCHNTSPSDAYEPGSGSTILSYAGICTPPNNIQSNPDDYYHVHSLEQLITYSRSGGGDDCPVKTFTGNHEPTAEIPLEGGFYIPISTPFSLTGVGTDPDGDDLLYCWEQYDLGPESIPGSPSGNAPIFRSWPPNPSPTRVFPRMQNIVNNVSSTAEVLPTYSRDLTFRMTVRDAQMGGGGTVWDEIAFMATDEAGPFQVTYPNNSIQWSVGDYVEVTWDVANTDGALVNSHFVNIKLSTDGGYNYPITLVENVPNTGSFNIVVPNEITNAARIMVEAADHIFFDISNSNFEIVPATQPGYSLDVTPYSQQVCTPDPAVINLDMMSLVGYDSLVNFTVSGLPSGAVPVFSNNPALPSVGSVLNIETENMTEEGTYEIEIMAVAPGADTSYRTTFVEFVISDFSTFAPIEPANGSSGVSELPTFNWSGSIYADSYIIEIATNPVFGDSTVEIATGILDTFYTPSATLEKSKLYYWRISASNECGSKEFEQIQAFHTETFSCLGYESINVPMNISNVGLPTVESTLTVPIEGIINDLNVTQVKGNHDRVNHLDVSLISPSLTEVELFSNICVTSSNFNLGLDDEAPNDVGSQCPPVGSFKPEGSLTDFDGENAQGIWTLKVTVNNNAGAGGELQNWSLQICANVSPSAPYLVTNDTMPVKPGDYRIITNEFLLSEDDNNPPEQLTYTLITIPENGAIFFLGNELGVGDIFRQSSINAGNVRYAHDGGPSEFDNFTFAVNNDEGGWFGTPQFNIKMDENVMVSSKEIENENEVFLFPNPANNVLNIQFKNPVDGKLNVSISNVQGSIIRNAIFENSTRQLQLNTSGISSGIYFVQIRTGDKVFTEKVIIQK